MRGHLACRVLMPMPMLFRPPSNGKPAHLSSRPSSPLQGLAGLLWRLLLCRPGASWERGMYDDSRASTRLHWQRCCHLASQTGRAVLSERTAPMAPQADFISLAFTAAWGSGNFPIVSFSDLNTAQRKVMPRQMRLCNQSHVCCPHHHTALTSLPCVAGHRGAVELAGGLDQLWHRWL